MKNKELLFRFSRQIIKKRHEKNISQQKLSELCDCHFNTIYRLEAMKHDPSLELSLKIAKVLDISLDAMVDLVLDEKDYF